MSSGIPLFKLVICQHCLINKIMHVSGEQYVQNSTVHTYRHAKVLNKYCMPLRYRIPGTVPKGSWSTVPTV